MDEQFRQMLVFRNTLEHFNGLVRASLADLGRHNDMVSPVWQDEMRKEYETHYADLREQIQRYDAIQAPAYLDFLAEKLEALEKYLHG